MPLRKVNRQTPRDLATVIHKAIEAEPKRRYQTAEELADDLQRFLRDEPIRARHVTVWGEHCAVVPAQPRSLRSHRRGFAGDLCHRADGVLADRGGEKPRRKSGRTRETDQRPSCQASLADEAEQRHLAETHMRDAEKARDEQKRAAKETKAVSEFLVFDMIGGAPARNATMAGN